VSIEVFRRLEELSGQQIHEMFDYICGVSTGSILGFLLGIKKYNTEDLISLYRNLSSEIFEQNRWIGRGQLVVNHSYYNTENFQNILRDIFGEDLLIMSSQHENMPKCSAVSALVNRHVLKPYVWRNYSVVPSTTQGYVHWPGTCRASMWQAVRASSAAPGYFEEFKQGNNIHQDGAMLTNNPTGVAIRECNVLWPDYPLKCVVSVGTGRHEPIVGPSHTTSLSLSQKLLKVVDSATSVQGVHSMMYDLLPKGTYFRFNPFLREQMMIDEYQEERMDAMVEDAQEYIRRNDYKFRACVEALQS